ncbi:MAG TPA: immunoglobulin-like domain-containing protein [Chitinophagales bacterium]|nr:immunoglobulin-like domain-containing protein [Chitinophagales bacterium]
MKRNKIELALVFATVILLMVTGCKKEDTPSKVMTVSRPVITLNGPAIVSLNVGESYVDQGATYLDTLYGDNGNITTTTQVNTSEEGFVIVRYSAFNKYGFEGTATRLVAVTTISDALDISGLYARTSNGAEANVTKLGRGVFQTDNVSGAASGGTATAFFMFKGDSTIVMPDQYLPAFSASAAFVDPVYDFTASPPNYSYVIDNPYVFAPSLRTFEKQ